MTLSTGTILTEIDMYKIIGADGREYGPVKRGPIAAMDYRRAAPMPRRKCNRSGATEWKTLAGIPNFMLPLVSPTARLRRSHPRCRVQGATQMPGADKKIMAGVFALLLGCLGIHKFILGYTGAGITMLLITVLTCGIGGAVTGLIGFIEGIIYLTKSNEEFVQTYIRNKKAWF